MTVMIDQLADSFWNIRGSFKVLGLLDVGSQMSLAGLSSGGFVLLDSYPLTGEVMQAVLKKTEGGRLIKAILNLHPFHTVHVRAVAEVFPAAKLYGTRRHVARAPDLRWEKIHTEDPELSDVFGEDFVFSVPRGVDFIPRNESLHFASVLAFHKVSKTLHVDDTLGFSELPLVGGLQLHPSLGSVLQKRPGAVAEFRAWLTELVELCQTTEHLCTAHMKKRPGAEVERELVKRIREASNRVERKLTSHEKRYG
jgi:hypothetical protein